MSGRDDDALLAGEGPLHSALASIPGVSVIVVDREVRIRALHGAALERRGYVHSQMLGKRVEDAMPKHVSERVTPLFENALAGQEVTIHQGSEDGGAFYESTFSPVRVNGQIVAATMTSRDITAQKLAEEKLSQQRWCTRTIFPSAGGCSKTCSPAGRPRARSASSTATGTTSIRSQRPP